LIERGGAARDAGLDSLFVGDHHATAAPYLQNVPILGRILAEWGERPVGALFLLPMWDPVLLAEQIGTLAAIAPGRFIAQCCVGADPAQFAAMGADVHTRGREFERCFAVLQQLLAGEEITRDGEEPFRICPVPSEPVEYWIGADARIAIDRAARLADGWLVGPNVLEDDACKLLDFFLERCSAHGREPKATPIRRNIHVAADERELDTVVRPAIARAGLGVEADKVIVGTVPQVVEAFGRLARAGFSDVIVRHFLDDQAAVLDSYQRLAEVRELVRGA
jgi:alkanesulfonate monooxygenase SsuD/methylene tetrahydromethanopterin reductase-like flavin-dependent oxidoreductase (luciferase family)